MTQQTRYFLVGSALIIVIGLGTGVVAVYNGNLPGRRTVGPAELAYLSSDVTAVAYADVKHIMSSEFHQRLQSALPTGQGREQLLAETGIDLEHDIDTVVAGLSGDGGPSGSPVVLVRGRFDASQIEAVATRHGATIEDYHGRRLILEPISDSSTSDATATPRGQGAVALLEPGLVAIGGADAVRRAIDVADRQDGVVKNAELMKFVGEVSGSADAWIVGHPIGLNKNPALPESVRDQLSTVQWFALTAGVDRGVNCRLRAEARDEKAGEEMRTAVNGAIALVKIMAGKDGRLDGVLNSVQTTGTGSNLDVSFTLPADVLNMLPGMTAATPAQ